MVKFCLNNQMYKKHPLAYAHESVEMVVFFVGFGINVPLSVYFFQIHHLHYWKY